MDKITLDGVFEVRLESVGGLGANVCAKILGETGASLGLTCAGFSSYGSEKKGSPVKGFIRFAPKNTEIRQNSPVEKPNALVIFHENLCSNDTVLAGADENTNVVINTRMSAEEARKALKLRVGTVFAIDALKIAEGLKTRVNMVMLGAAARVCGFIPLDALVDVLNNTLGKKYPQARKSNEAGVRRGFEAARGEYFGVCDAYDYVKYKEIERDLGYANAPIGGVITEFGSTVTNDVSSAREGRIPLFIKEKCINCGLCETTCPDFVYQFAKGEYKGKQAMVNLGADYHHCKGCLRCAEVCPTKAIVAANERDYDVSKLHIRNIELIPKKLPFEYVGSSGWVDSESAVNA